MILDEIVLHDFGVYGGRQKIELTPLSREKPIILFGGLNGGGKTTLLDALQLCFFGNMAKCAGRGDLNYDEYLRRSVHHGAIAPEAAVEVSFRHRVDGEEQSWRLIRSWTAGEYVRERFQVIRNDRLDKLASDQWSAQVEDFIPARIAHLFLFDGEKVEGYADLEQAPGLIKTAIQNLLGLDVVERLSSDLMSIERKKKTELKAPQEVEELNSLREDLRRLVTKRTGLVHERASALNDLDRLRRKVDDFEQRYEREGGALFEDRSRLEAELAVAQRGHEAVKRSLRELAAGIAPLGLVPALLNKVSERAVDEEQARRSEQAADAATLEHKAFLHLATTQGLPAEFVTQMRDFSQKRLSELKLAANRPRHLNLDDAARISLSALQTGNLSDVRNEVSELLVQERNLKLSVDHIRLQIASVPSEASVADLLTQREATRDALKLAEYEQNRRDQEILRLDRELEVTRERETRLLESTAREQFEHEDVERLLSHSSKVRATLADFREAVVTRHVARIEAFVLESFRQLIRKPTLVTNLTIDPRTFAVELTGSGGRLIRADRLSAGERQLLAVALLWGLAKASGRPLPTVIDTPLGRLDSEHRSRLVSRYFPHASHQVMLLSTDEEITDTYYQALKPAIGRSYRLRYDDAQARTVIEPGYFDLQGVA